jgi:hypothetical protein
MEINTALYMLGDEGSEGKIVEGLTDSNVVVRRASAKSMVFLKEHPTTKMITALEDSDDAVRRDIAIALRMYPDAGAVDNLLAILTNGSGPDAKQAAMDTLKHYADKGIVDGLAARLIELLANPKVSNHEDRLRIVQLLKKPALIKQVKEADQYENLPHKIYFFYEKKETNNMVKDELNQLLLVIDVDN